MCSNKSALDAWASQWRGHDCHPRASHNLLLLIGENKPKPSLTEVDEVS